MARDRSNKEKEELHGQLRQKEKQIKHLKKELARAQKNQKKIEALTDNFITEEADEAPQQDASKCPKCNSKKVTEIDLGKAGLFIMCSDCNYRKRLTNTK